MKPILFLFTVFIIFSCKKTTEATAAQEPMIGKMNSLNGGFWKVFRSTYIQSRKYSRSDTTGWVEYVGYTSWRNDQVILFRQDSTYECDLEISFALLISPTGKYVPDKEGDFDSVEFRSPYAIQKVGVKKIYYPEKPFDYTVEMTVENNNAYYRRSGRIELAQVN